MKQHGTLALPPPSHGVDSFLSFSSPIPIAAVPGYVDVVVPLVTVCEALSSLPRVLVE